MLATLRFAVRRLLRDPGFALAAILLLALGLGVNTGLFSVVRSLVARPVPWAQDDDLVRVYLGERPSGFAGAISYPEYEELAALESVFSQAEFHADVMIFSLSRGRSEAPAAVTGEIVSAGFLPMLGLKPLRGRTFVAAEDHPGAPATAMLTERGWRQRFAADPDIVGKRVVVNGTPVEIVGVAAADFRGTIPGFDTDLVLPWGLGAKIDRAAARSVGERTRRELFFLGRLAPEVSFAAAESALDAVSRRMAADHPEAYEERRLVAYRAAEVRIHPSLDRALLPVGAFLLVVGTVMIAVVCANLGGLLMARAAARRPEMALRAALGAARPRLVAQMLGESVVLAACGGLAGIGVSVFVARLLEIFPPPLPVPIELGAGATPSVWLFTAATSVAVGLVLGLAPALAATRHDRSGVALRAASNRSSGGSALWRRLLIGAQVAASTLLLLLAASALRSLHHSQTVDLGFDVDRLAAVHVDPVLGGIPQEEARRTLAILADELAARPEVAAAALASRIPFGVLGSDSTLLGDGLGAPETSMVSPGFFDLMGQSLLSGRGFDDGDRAGAAPVAIVNATLAESLRESGDGSVVGRSLSVEENGGQLTVVGVVAAVKDRRIGRAPRPHLYLPWTQHDLQPMALVMRARGRVGPLPELGIRLVAGRDARMPILEARTLRQHVGLMLYPARLSAALLGSVGVITLVLSTLGLWGVVAFAAERRRAELAIRSALGASRSRLTRLMVGEALTVTLLGVGLGAAALGATLRPLRSLLYGLGPADVPALAAVALLLATIALLAAWMPARRAATADPMRALRDG